MTVESIFGRKNLIARNNKINGTEAIKENTEKSFEERLFELVEHNKQIIGNKTYAFIPLDLLCIDPSYQRVDTYKEYKVQSIIDNYDVHKMNTLTVVVHLEEKKYYIVDGLHRYLALKALGKDSAECEIITFEGTPEERRKQEAELFIGQTEPIEPITPIQKHGGRVILGDEAAILMEEAKEKYGICFAYGPGGVRNKIKVGSYNQIYKIAKNNGKEGIDWVFELLKFAGFDRKPNGYSKYIIKALNDLYTLYPEYREEITTVMGDYLRDYNPIGVKANAISAYPMLFETTAVSLFLEDVYTVLTKKRMKRKVEGNRVKIYR